ncbi:type III polyketide synthase [Salinibacillus xinjiangensis]|uniref:Type III polyketide synthase n=1 Tax=Salinibacillus xinjiangensis TaxID=1229268 RepID=A0A6G1XBK6_9BACI|nr:3-oxoacyl-[acyl-carrier-protein] synthase III C-terminal domain-containing protein [Salinibacillus xinjiangensis]MRG88299.1 type III polyketide synthase [Salinibacillus xinjiangensis]
MPVIASVGVGIPRYRIPQEEAKELIREIFPRDSEQLERLLPVFDHAFIKERQMVVPIDWFKEAHTLAERNQKYLEEAIPYTIEAVEDCLHNSKFLNEQVSPREIDCIIFASSTGIATPSIDAHLINELPFSEYTTRIPLWGLGCAGGASGLARASEWLLAHPDKNTLLINLEFCSLAFQKHDRRKSNFIGSALFGDGVSCTLIMGDQSPLQDRLKHTGPHIMKTSSRTKKGALDVMGWDIQNSGFHVIFAKSIPRLVETFWYEHLQDFLQESQHQTTDFPFLTAHPGGTKVLQAMERILEAKKEKFRYSYKILEEHGNMSSPTVLYVLKEAMESSPPTGTKSLLTALGPGFSSEIVMLEWKKS